VTPHEAEKIRRRDRTQRGLSPAQRTKRSKDKGRAAKRPGKGERSLWKKTLVNA
jgi:hypothetical protein